MENTLIDRETLGQFIDGLIKNKPLPVNTVEELTKFREEQIEALDNKISYAIFGQLTDEQLKEINTLLDDPTTSSEVFEGFFSKCGVDLKKTIADAMQSFGVDFLQGGQNA